MTALDLAKFICLIPLVLILSVWAIMFLAWWAHMSEQQEARRE